MPATTRSRGVLARSDAGATHLELGTVVAVVGLGVVLAATMLANAARDTFGSPCTPAQQSASARC